MLHLISKQSSPYTSISNNKHSVRYSISNIRHYRTFDTYAKLYFQCHFAVHPVRTLCTQCARIILAVAVVVQCTFWNIVHNAKCTIRKTHHFGLPLSILSIQCGCYPSIDLSIYFALQCLNYVHNFCIRSPF